MRRIALLASQLLIVVVLVDGLVDIAYPAARFAIQRGRALLGSEERLQIVDWDVYRQREVAGLGAVVPPISSSTLNVDDQGRRSTGNPPRESGVTGLLLGPSQAFGYGVPDQDSMAAALERRLDDVTILNFSAPGRTTPESMTQWLKLVESGLKPDFVLLVVSKIEIVKACWPRPVQDRSQHLPALVRVAKELAGGGVGNATVVPPCETEEGRDGLIARTLYEIRAAVAMARTLGTRFAIVLTPTTHENDAALNALASAESAEYFRSTTRTLRELHRRILAEDIPEIFDTSDAFSGRDQPFMDMGSHFDREGAELLTTAIIDRLPDDFFGAGEVTSGSGEPAFR